MACCVNSTTTVSPVIKEQFEECTLFKDKAWLDVVKLFLHEEWTAICCAFFVNIFIWNVKVVIITNTLCRLLWQITSLSTFHGHDYNRTLFNWRSHKLTYRVNTVLYITIIHFHLEKNLMWTHTFLIMYTYIPLVLLRLTIFSTIIFNSCSRSWSVVKYLQHTMGIHTLSTTHNVYTHTIYNTQYLQHTISTTHNIDNTQYIQHTISTTHNITQSSTRNTSVWQTNTLHRLSTWH